MIFFNWLLRLCPRAFREAFGDDMRQVFVEQRHTARQRGFRSHAAFWARTVGGMASAAWRERRETRHGVVDRLPIAETLATDVRLALRMMLGRPLFATTVVVAVSIGTGGVATIFSGLNALVLRPLPGVADGDRLVLIDRRSPDASEGVSASANFFEYVRTHAQSVTDVAAWSRVPLTIVIGQTAHALSANIVSTNYFDLLGVRPVAGRFFDPDPDAAEPAIVLSYATWVGHFHGDPAVGGRIITVNGRPYRISGVAPAGFHGVFTPLRVDAWVPLAAQPHVHPQRDLANQPWLWTFARLRDGIERSQARSELSALTAAWAASGADPYTTYSSMRLTPLTGLPDDARQALLGFGAVLLGAAALVLVIAAANVSTLLAMRATGRRREMGIRTALGAGRGRLVRQLLTETLLLFLAGGLGGTLLAVAGTSALERLPIPSEQGLLLELSPDLRVLAFSIAVSLAVGLLFGIVPALRSAGRSPAALLRTSAGSGRRTLTSSGLIVAQMTCSLVLLTTAGLFVRAVSASASINPGFDARGVVLAAFNTGSYGYGQDRGRVFYETLRHRLETTPGVESVTFANTVPLTFADSGAAVTIEGSGSTGDERKAIRVGTEMVDVHYFETLRIPLVAGRDFSTADGGTSGDVAIVNETFVRRAWPDESAAGAVGRTIRVGAQRVTIVGVAGDSKYTTLGELPKPFVYRSYGQRWNAARTLFVRVAGRPVEGARVIEEAVAAIDPLLPRVGVTTLAREAQVSLLPQRVAAMVTGVLGFAGLVLAAIGLYGLVSYGVALRLREIGVRLALGATRADVVRLVVTQGVRLTAAGVALGLLASVFATRLVEAYLLNVSSLDAVAFGGGVALLLVSALTAAVVPARRASAADPLIVLRTE